MVTQGLGFVCSPWEFVWIINILLAQQLDCGSLLFLTDKVAGDAPSLFLVSFSYFASEFHQYTELAFANSSCLNTDKFFPKIKGLTNWHIPIKKKKNNTPNNKWNDELFFGL